MAERMMYLDGEIITFEYEEIRCPDCGVRNLDVVGPGLYTLRCSECDFARVANIFSAEAK